VTELAAQAGSKRGSIDVVTLQTLSRRDDVAELTAGYGVIVADDCDHVPAAGSMRLFCRREPCIPRSHGRC
jgi:superfamily II DNA or RNA helicase